MISRYCNNQNQNQYNNNNTMNSLRRIIYDIILLFLCTCCFQTLIGGGSSNVGVGGVVNAYSTGAGSCDGNKAAVGGDHLDTYDSTRQALLFPLAKGKVTFVLNNDQTLEPSIVTSLQTQTNYKLKLITEYTEGFKGVLIRLSTLSSSSSSIVDTSTALVPIDTSILKYSDRCVEPVIGLTHVNNKGKQFVEATLRFDEPITNVTIDVTMVAVNNATASLYGYDQFLFDFTNTINIKNLINDIEGDSTTIRYSSSTNIHGSTWFGGVATLVITLLYVYHFY